ncbi:HalOD1 output domain-containing protein [Natrialbaceae archaeon A-arb3/5]
MSGNTPTNRLIPVGDGGGRTVYHHEGRGTYHVWCDTSEYESASTALLDGFATVLDVDPVDLDPLSACVDPDALNAMVAHWQTTDAEVANGTVSFTYSQCHVTVRADGEIVIEPETSNLVRA